MTEREYSDYQHSKILAFCYFVGNVDGLLNNPELDLRKYLKIYREELQAKLEGLKKEKVQA